MNPQRDATGPVGPQQNDAQSPGPPALIDAYCHFGLPRFSNVADALTVLRQSGIDRTVLVLGPDIPDYVMVQEVCQRGSDHTRAVGIPFGQTQEQVQQSVDLQIQTGVLGLRIQEQHHLTDPYILENLGRRGRWIYAINCIRSPEVMRTLLDWLDRFPDSHVAAPHFVRPQPLWDGSTGDDLKRTLVAHPKFYPIFSRHGGNGSLQPYPHADLRPWVEQVIEICGWQRILWGSEYPVIFWRNETMADCLYWLEALLPQTTPTQRAAFHGHNAAQAIFAQPAPPAQSVTIPTWVEAQFNHDRTVQLFATNGLETPMALYAQIHHAYVAALQQTPELRLHDFVVACLANAVETDHGAGTK